MGSPANDEAPTTGSAVDAAASLITERYELVRDGDFEGACGLYSADFTELFIELVGTDAADCVEAHQEATTGVDEYLATVKVQERAGLTPFFYVPSDIEVVTGSISSEADGLAFLDEGAVVSLDAREFEDGSAQTPGWLAGQQYVKRGSDGEWRFVAMTEQ